MNFLKGLNKEQWTALGVSALSALMLLFGFSGGGSAGAGTLKAGAEEPYNAQRARYVELPGEKFDGIYWGKSPFRIESAVKLPIPLLKVPEPREEEMLVPAFRPGPAWESYNALGAAVKYPTLSPGAPLIAEANLPTAAEVADLVKLQEPEAPVKPDRRAEQERQFAIVKVKNGGPIEATKVELIGTAWHGKRKGGGTLHIQAADVAEVLQNRTNEEQARYDSENIRPGGREAEERLKLAQRCLDLGMIPEGREELKKAVEARKDYLEAILALGQLAIDSTDFETAIATYRAGIEAGAPAGELWYEIGRCLRTLSFTEGALVAFEKSIEAQPRLHRSRIALARTLIDAGQGPAAVEAATDFFTKLGNSPDTTAAQKAEASLARGLAYLRVGQLEKARADVADCLKVIPENAEALNAGGVALALLGQFPQAAPEFVKAIRANQYLIEAWTNLAALFLLGGKWAEAEKLAAAAVQRDPSSAEAVLSVGLAQLATGNKDAPKEFDLAAKIEPTNLQVLMVTGLLSLREGQNEAALEKFVAALRSEFYFLPAYSAAAAAYLRTGRKLAESRDEASARKADEMRVNAETLLRRIREFDPSRPGAHAALGCAYAAMQRPDEAKESLRKASSLSQKGADPLVYYALGYLDYYYGQAGTAAGNLEIARSQFDQAVKLEGTATDPFSLRVIEDCKKAIDAIDLWDRTSLRLIEEFNGPDSKNIGSNWLEKEGAGIHITRAGGRGKFAGKQAVREFALTSLMHEVPGADFYSFELTFFPEKVDRAEFGMSLFHTQQGSLHSGFSVGIDASGKPRYQANSSDNDLDIHDMAVGWQEIKTPLPSPKEITIRVTMTEGKNRARVFTIYFWDPTKADWIAAAAPVTVNPPRAAWQVGAWVHTLKDHEVLLFVDNIKVLDQVKK